MTSKAIRLLLVLLVVAVSAGPQTARAVPASPWRLPLGSSYSTPLVAANGLVYVFGADQVLHAADATTGQVRWSFSGGYAGATPSPLVGGHLLISVTGESPAIVALDAMTGQERWRYAGQPGSFPSVKAVDDETIYVGDDGAAIFLERPAIGALRIPRSWIPRATGRGCPPEFRGCRLQR